jgi:RNA polymerase sigma-70 factor (ECF subfamily)
VRQDGVRAAVAGDAEAVGHVLASIRPLVVRYCHARMSGFDPTFPSADDITDDLVQDVFLAVLAAVPRFRYRGRPFLAFVYGIAAHKVADAHRRAARDREVFVANVPNAVDPSANAEDWAVRTDLARRVRRLLATLSQRQRDVVRMRVLDGLSAEETAEALGTTPGSVRITQHRALRQLRAATTIFGVI